MWFMLVQLVGQNTPLPRSDEVIQQKFSHRKQFSQTESACSGDEMQETAVAEDRDALSCSKPLRELPRMLGKRRNVNREPVRYWSEEEHKLFLVGVQKFGGRNYKALSEHIKTRTPTQVRTHLQKYLLKLQVR